MSTQESTDASPYHVELRELTMDFEDHRVIDGLDLSFERGKITVVLGGSGSGKSTLLRLIAGLVAPTQGAILVDGQDVPRLGRGALAEVRKGLAMMFQGGALLDSLSVYENLALPLRERRRVGEKEIREAVHEGLAAVGLSGIDDLLPGALSGGMVKRVALARALIGHPQLLLCDEPFSGLDPLSTKLIEALLVRVNRELGVTMVVVSHHVPSTLRMSDEIVLLLPKRVVRGSAEELLGGDDQEVHRFLDETVDEATDVLAHAAEYESERSVGGGPA